MITEFQIEIKRSKLLLFEYNLHFSIVPYAKDITVRVSRKYILILLIFYVKPLNKIDLHEATWQNLNRLRNVVANWKRGSMYVILYLLFALRLNSAVI